MPVRKPTKPTTSIDRVDDRLVDRAVEDLRRIMLGGQVGLMAEVGHYLLKNFIGGEEQARSKNPDKPASLNRLAERAAEFGMTPSGLTKSVAVAMQVRQLGKRIAERLGPTHHIALLPVRDPDEKRLLALAAANERWTVDVLRREVRRIQDTHPGGRPRLPRLRLLVDRATRLLLGDEPIGVRTEDLEAITPEDAQRLIRRVNALQAALERVEKQLLRVSARRGG